MNKQQPINLQLQPDDPVDKTLNYLLAIELGINVDHSQIGMCTDIEGKPCQLPNLLDDIQVAEKLCKQWNTFNITIEKVLSDDDKPVWVVYADHCGIERNHETEHPNMARAINLCILAYRGKIKRNGEPRLEDPCGHCDGTGIYWGAGCPFCDS